MSKFVFALAALSGLQASAYAQQCAMSGGPECATVECRPRGYCNPESAQQPESGLRQPEGAYIRGPESGEFEGAASSFGLRGFGFKLPSVSFEGPEVRLPHLTRYRKNPVFHSESARAPFVRGPVSEFNQVGRQEFAPRTEAGQQKPESAPRPEAAEEPQYQCVPPAPCSDAEQRLRRELARKENEIRVMQERFQRLEKAVNRMAELNSSTDSVGHQTKSSNQTPRILMAGHSDDFEELRPPVVESRTPSVEIAENPPRSSALMRTIQRVRSLGRQPSSPPVKTRRP